MAHREMITLGFVFPGWEVREMAPASGKYRAFGIYWGVKHFDKIMF
jgi:hypothetical protein